MAALLPRLLWVGILAGLAGGTAATVFYGLWTAPLILEAEAFEEVAEDHGHGWAPAEGWERTLATMFANVLLAFAGGLVMAGLFTLLRQAGWRRGIFYGLAAFIALHLAPAIGLPPELPGAAAAPLLARQAWWFLTAGATLAAIVLVVRYRTWPWRLAAVALALAPHLIGAPGPDAHGDTLPEELRVEFIAASLAVSFAFWLVVGAVAGYASERLGLGAGRTRGAARMAGGPERGLGRAR